MNNYYTILGSQLSSIRTLLNWPQIDLAKKLGVSRATIVSIEKDPRKMSKVITLALFLIVDDELKNRRNILNEINFNEWNDKEHREGLLEKFTNGLGITERSLSGLLPNSPSSGGVISTIVTLPSLWKKPSLAESEESINAEDLQKTIISSVEYTESRIRLCFNIESFDVKSFMLRVKEDEKEDLDE